jgi:hypothetical protein
MMIAYVKNTHLLEMDQCWVLDNYDEMVLPVEKFNNVTAHDWTNNQSNIRSHGPIENNPNACLRVEHIFNTPAHNSTRDC